MLNPLFDRKHIKEYLSFGIVAGVLFMIPVLLFLSSHTYENSYYLYIGCGLFMAVIFFYSYKLLYQRYDRKRATSMLIAGHIATLVGVIVSVLLSIIATLIYFPGLFDAAPQGRVVGNSPPQLQTKQPSGILFMILVIAVLGNGGAGSFISVVTSYAGKQNQTKDKPTPLETDLPPRKPL